MIEEALAWHLKQHAETSIVGDNIYPVILPAGVTADSIVYRKLKGGRRQNIDDRADCSQPIYQVSAWSSDYARARDLANRILAALEAFDGVWEPEAAPAIEVQAVQNVDSRDDVSDPDDGSEEFMFVRHEEFRIQFVEVIP